MANLAGKVNSMLGLRDDDNLLDALDMDYSERRADGATTWLPTSLNDYRKSHATDPDFEDSPSRRALHGFNLVENGGSAPKKKYAPFMKHTAAMNL